MKNLGEVREGPSAEVNVVPGSTIAPTIVTSLWMVPGTYIAEARVMFALPKQAQTEIHVISNDEKDAIANVIYTLPTGAQWLKNVGMLKITGSTSKQVLLCVRQDSGSTIACIGHLMVMRIN